MGYTTISTNSELAQLLTKTLGKSAQELDVLDGKQDGFITLEKLVQEPALKKNFKMCDLSLFKEDDARLAAQGYTSFSVIQRKGWGRVLKHKDIPLNPNWPSDINSIYLDNGDGIVGKGDLYLAISGKYIGIVKIFEPRDSGVFSTDADIGKLKQEVPAYQDHRGNAGWKLHVEANVMETQAGKSINQLIEGLTWYCRNWSMVPGF